MQSLITKLVISGVKCAACCHGYNSTIYIAGLSYMFKLKKKDINVINTR